MKSVRNIRKDEAAVSPVIATILMVAITVVLAAVLYVMVSGLISGPGAAPQLIGVNPRNLASVWSLDISKVPNPHSLTTTSLLIRYASNATIVNPPGQRTLEQLKTATSGVQYIPVSGALQTDLRVNDVITLAKGGVYTSNMGITITDGSGIIWSGTLP